MEVRRELDRLRTEAQELTQRVDYLRYQVEEIGAANLRPAEDEDLAVERDRVANAERIIALSTTPMVRYTIASTGKNQSWTL